MKYKIIGGKELKGEITASGNKNAALPCIAACLLTDETIVLKNIPALEDVNVLLNILTSLGASIQKTKTTYKIKVSHITNTHISEDLANKIRASILLAGPMIARCGEIILPPPGGDVIGRRRLDTHIHSLSALGAKFSMTDIFHIHAKSLRGTHIFQDEASVTATENTLMVAVLAKGRTTIENAACEPHVQDLCNMLIAMGAHISGVGSNIITIDGVKKLHGCDFSIGPDFMEIGSLIGLAGATHSEIVIHNTEPKHMKMCEIGFKKLGIRWKYDGKTIIVPKKTISKNTK